MIFNVIIQLSKTLNSLNMPIVKDNRFLKININWDTETVPFKRQDNFIQVKYVWEVIFFLAQVQNKLSKLETEWSNVCFKKDYPWVKNTPTCCPFFSGLKIDHSTEYFSLDVKFQPPLNAKMFESSTMNELNIERIQNVWPVKVFYKYSMIDYW